MLCADALSGPGPGPGPVLDSWKARRPSVSGHTGRYDLREIVNTILCQARTGCQWRYPPHDLPPPGAVYYYFGTWRDDGTTRTVHDLLRWPARERRRRRADPSAVVLDSQTVRACTNAPRDTTGLDPGKKSPGRTRGLAVDILALLDRVAAQGPGVRKAWVDAGFKNTVVDHGAAVGIEVEVVHREPEARGPRVRPGTETVGGGAGLRVGYDLNPSCSLATILAWPVEWLASRRMATVEPASRSSHGCPRTTKPARS